MIRSPSEGDSIAAEDSLRTEYDTAPAIENSTPLSSKDNSRNQHLGAVDQSPWTNSRLWILQLVVLALYLIRLALIVAFHLDTTSLAIEFSTLALFLVPVVYAALNYALQGAALTAAWVTLLAIPRFLYAVGNRDYVAAWAEVLQIVLLDILAFLIGQRVTVERKARQLAESAHQAHLSAEALYRDLFDSNRSPILIIDANGFVVETNASAQRTFGSPTPEHNVAVNPKQPQRTPVRLVDMIGADASSHVLTRLVSEQRSTGAEDEDRSHPIERVEPFAVEVEGRSILYRPNATMLGGADPSRRMQVVFEDVTEETRRHDLMEAYASQVVLGQEEERRHIAQELHDGPLQTLIHLCRQIDVIEGASVPKSEETNALSDLRTTVEGTVAELRSIARGLRPSILDDLGLVASINQLLSDASERQQVETSFGITGANRRLSPTIELTLFRIAQEALSNIERHAAARRVAIGLNFEPGGLRLLVKDDGVGFNVSRIPEADGSKTLGLPGMSERARLIGARLVIHSGEGAGTTVDVWVPATILEGN
jgi:signal transduction histidine kinase